MATEFISPLDGRQRSPLSSNTNPSPSFLDVLYGQMRNTGYLSASRWLVLLFPNQRVRDSLGMSFVVDTTRLAINCKTIITNDRSWYTSEQNYLSAGAGRSIPYKRNTNNAQGLRLAYNCGSDLFEKEFFEGWLDHIQDPITKQWKFYDDYAKDSDVFILLLPKNVRNISEAMEGMYNGSVTGMRLTEVYPYSINMNAGTLAYESAQSPMTVDIVLMYHDIVSLRGEKLTYSNTIPMVTDTGYPVIDNSGARAALDTTYRNLTRAVNGHTNRVIASRKAFEEDRRKRMSLLESYAKELDQYKNDNFPRAVDGKVVYQTPRIGGLDFGTTLLSQAQGFFGV